MATVSNTSNFAGLPNATNKSSKAIAENFDQFLQILTTQLKNQNPLDALDTNQFTQQLVQFAGVEQQIQTNDNLTALLATNVAATVTTALSFVGATVTADGATTSLKNGKASWNLDAARSGTATITIFDASGNQVYTTTKTLSAGEQGFDWDGKTASGTAAPDGQYQIVVSAKDATGQSMTVTTEISGVVDTVDVTGSSPVLKIGDVSIPIESVKSIRRT